jgi:hypothetical protein
MSKQTIWLAYRDVADYPRKSFERLAPPPTGAQLIKSQVIPGLHGYKDMHVNWHEATTRGGVTIRLVTYTESPLSEKEHQEIIEAAFKFARKQ